MSKLCHAYNLDKKNYLDNGKLIYQNNRTIAVQNYPLFNIFA